MSIEKTKAEILELPKGVKLCDWDSEVRMDLDSDHLRALAESHSKLVEACKSGLHHLLPYWDADGKFVLVADDDPRKPKMKHACDICCPADLFEKPVTMSEALDALKELDPSVCKPKMNKSDFRKDLEQLINQHSMENGSDTPDFILADYLVDAMDSFNQGVNRRSQRHLPPEQPEPEGVTDEMRLWFEGLPVIRQGCYYRACACGEKILYAEASASQVDEFLCEHHPHRLPTLPDGADSRTVHGLTPEPIVVKPNGVVLDILFFVHGERMAMSVVTNRLTLDAGTITRSPLLEIAKHEPYAWFNHLDFEHTKSDLEAFADGFDEPPVPRIEKDGEGCRVFVDDSYGGNDYWIDTRAMDGLRQYFGIENTPIYTPTRLTGEWTRVFPVQAKQSKIWREYVEKADTYSQGLVGLTERIIKDLPTEGIEVWRFTLTREK